MNLLKQVRHFHACVIVGKALKPLKNPSCDDFFASASNQPMIQKNC
jgi:hypothetical protein